MRHDSVEHDNMRHDSVEHDTRKGRHYYTTLYCVAKPRPSVYSSDWACPCHALCPCHAFYPCHAHYKART